MAAGYRARMSDEPPATPFDALQVLASQQVALAPGLRHIEIYTMRGPAHAALARPAGGSPGARRRARAVRWGDGRAARPGRGPLPPPRRRVGRARRRRRAGQLPPAQRPRGVHDRPRRGRAARQRRRRRARRRDGPQLRRRGRRPRRRRARPARRRRRHVRHPVGRLRGGGRAAAASRCCCSTASATRSCPSRPARWSAMLAGGGELVRLPGDGHLLAKSGDVMWERLEEWLPPVALDRRAVLDLDRGRGPTVGAVRFHPYHQLDGRPNVILDGSPTDGTVLTVTHWPGYPPPEVVAADTSGEMAFRLLEHRRSPRRRRARVEQPLRPGRPGVDPHRRRPGGRPRRRGRSWRTSPGPATSPPTATATRHGSRWC